VGLPQALLRLGRHAMVRTRYARVVVRHRSAC
jgi:hypothetical protein